MNAPDPNFIIYAIIIIMALILVALLRSGKR